MIEYPLSTLINLGCDDILVVTGGEHIGDIASYLGDGSRFGIRLTYRVQPEAGGVAEALGCAEGFIKDSEHFPVILGDNYFDEILVDLTKPTIIVKKVDRPERFGVYSNNEIVEKPVKPESNNAVTGLYVYDFKVFNQVRRLQKSERGELEITDINNWYIKENNAVVLEYPLYWSDMGTFDSLMEVANHVKLLS